MRVIAGSKRHIILDTPEGMSTRPTQDRIKETLFNMIGQDVSGSNFLDLFAGSGQMGIEALSRGAERAVFVESDKKASDIIKKNLSKTGFENESELISSDVFLTLKRLDGRYKFDYVFMDPPYNKLLEKSVLEALKDSSIIDEYTRIIVEASLETDFSYVTDLGFTIIKEKNYKTNKHVFIEKA